MSRFQAGVVLMCAALCVVEGFDILVMSFASSGVARDWGLTGATIGVLLSACPFGMAVGSAVVAPLADRIGRRPLTLLCLSATTVAMALSAATRNAAELTACRVLAGLAIGGLVASLPVLVSEYSPARRRGSAVALYTTGLPLGGVVGGSVATLVGSQFGWRGTFAAGALLTITLLLISVVALPESLDYLETRRPAHALERINRTLARMGRTPLAQLDEHQAAPIGVTSGILRGRSGRRTFLLWAAFLILMACFYFAASWTPVLLERSGLSAEQGIGGGMLLNVGGIAATLLFSVLALVVRRPTLTALAFLIGAVSFVAMGLSLGSLGGALTAAVAVGVTINAAASGLYSMAPDLYPASVRTTAVGWAASIGRIGAIVAPLLAGFLLDAGWTPQRLMVLFAAPFAVGGLCVLLIAKLGRPAREDTPAPAVGQPAPGIS
ncbi:MFS transporter [Amycolatopsis rhabdoformis]|uniref:MFS transporter n=1 Tax=Amycolatopsis rhabdoformis TaxID=1448059 RepID=A0ABZ1IJV2_9PSEU|nr:MFS transporter [Amycolatopsis rhabdoformis]WSE34711.1 MFS transporter [Amycolatopsis rhabdoformis]